MTVTPTTSAMRATSSQATGQPWAPANAGSKHSRQNSLKRARHTPAMTIADTAVSQASPANMEADLPEMNDCRPAAWPVPMF